MELAEASTAKGNATRMLARPERNNMGAAPGQAKLHAADRLTVALGIHQHFGQGFNGQPFNGGSHQPASAKKRRFTTHHLAEFRHHRGGQARRDFQRANDLAGLILHRQRCAGGELAG